MLIQTTQSVGGLNRPVPAAPTQAATGAAAATPGTISSATAEWRDVAEVSTLKTIAGAGLGALAAGSAASLLGPIAGVVGGVAGAALGGLLGRYSEILTYDTKTFLSDNWNRVDTRLHAMRHQRAENPRLPALGREHLRALDQVGDVRRSYDGWDSGRDLFALFSREGQASEPYQVQIEMAHLREGAQFQSELKLEVTHAGQPLTLVVKDGRAFREVDGQREPVNIPASYDTKFGHLRLDLDKGTLRELGWKDGSPLLFTATTRGADGAESDSLSVSSDATTDGNALKDGFARWEGKTVYYVVTDRFHNGDKTNDQDVEPDNIEAFHGGDYQGVIDKLDYLKDLGVDCIWLSCPYLNDRDFFGGDGYHGYWPHDFHQAEPSFGSKEKLKELTNLAHAKGMKVMLDVVINHTGYQHPYTRDPGKADWYHKEGKLRWIGQWAIENQDLAGLPDLALENPEVSSHVTEAHRQWLKDTGVDAFRLDAVRHVPRGFAREFVETMKADKPDFFSVGEVFWRDPNYVAAYQRETQESMFDFPLAYAIRNVFSGIPERTASQRFALASEVGKHNITESMRLRSSNGDESMKVLSRALDADKYYDNPKKLMTFVDNHDMMRFMTDCDGDTTRLKNALGFLYACRGIPSLYYGTESAMEGWGPENRKDMEWDKDPDMKAFVSSLTATRKASAALQHGTQKELLAADDAYALARIRSDEQVVCVFNNAQEEKTLRIPADDDLPEGAKLKSMLDDGSATVVDGHIQVTLPPRSFAYYAWQA
jgi:alpha-amylase